MQPASSQEKVQPSSTAQLELQLVPEHVTGPQVPPSQLNHELSLAEQSVPTHSVLQSGPLQVCWHPSPVHLTTQPLGSAQPSSLLVHPLPSQMIMHPVVLSWAQPALQSVPEHVIKSQDPPSQLDQELSLAEQSIPTHTVSQSGPLQVCWHPSPAQLISQSSGSAQPSSLLVQPSPSQVKVQVPSWAQPALQSVPEHVTESQVAPSQLTHEL